MKGGKYKLRKAPKRDLYWVVGQDGTKHSKEPIPKERAEAQMRALYAVWRKKEAPVRGGAVSVEERLAELNAMIPSEQKWNAMKAARPSADLKSTYAEFRADREAQNRARAESGAMTKEREAKRSAALSDLAAQNEAYTQYYKEHPEEAPVMCNFNAELKPIKERTSAAECKRRHDAVRIQQFESKPLGKFVSGLTKAGDFLVENFGEALPGVGKLVAEAYKANAPFTSAFSAQNALLGQGIPTHAVGAGGDEHSPLAKFVTDRNSAKTVIANTLKQFYKLREEGRYDEARILSAQIEKAIRGVEKDAEDFRYKGIPALGKMAAADWSTPPPPKGKGGRGVRGGIDEATARERAAVEEFDRLDATYKDVSKEIFDLERYIDELVRENDEEPLPSFEDRIRDAEQELFDLEEYSLMLHNRLNELVKIISDIRKERENRKRMTEVKKPTSASTGRGGKRLDVSPPKARRIQKLKDSIVSLNAKVESLIARAEGIIAAAETMGVQDDAFFAQIARMESELEEMASRRDEYEAELESLEAGPLEGSGIFSNLYKKAKSVVSGVVDKVKAIHTKATTQYPASVRKVLDTVGDKPIVEMYVRRDPIRSPLHTVLNLITLGKWNAARSNFPYDKVFHLGIEVAVKIDEDSNVIARYVMEKNERINIARAAAHSKDTELMRVPLEGSPTMRALLDKAQQRMGTKNFFDYDAFTNNCQDWVIAVLTAAGLTTPQLTQFVKQPLDKVVESLPAYTPLVAKAATTAAAVVGTAVGGSKNKSDSQKYLDMARRVAQRAGYTPSALELSDKPSKKLMLTTPTGKKVYFGQSGADDFLQLRLAGQKEKADLKRRAYLARATKIKGAWRTNRYSPNMLAIEILWPPKFR